MIDQIQSICFFFLFFFIIIFFMGTYNSLYTCLIHVFILAHNHVFILTTSQHE